MRIRWAPWAPPTVVWLLTGSSFAASSTQAGEGHLYFRLEATTVPEPAAITLAGAAMLAILTASRRWPPQNVTGAHAVGRSGPPIAIRTTSGSDKANYFRKVWQGYWLMGQRKARFFGPGAYSNPAAALTPLLSGDVSNSVDCESGREGSIAGGRWVVLRVTRVGIGETRRGRLGLGSLRSALFRIACKLSGIARG